MDGMLDGEGREATDGNLIFLFSAKVRTIFNIFSDVSIEGKKFKDFSRQSWKLCLDVKSPHLYFSQSP